MSVTKTIWIDIADENLTEDGSLKEMEIVGSIWDKLIESIS